MPAHEHSWVWAVLPAECELVGLPDDPELANVVAAAGLRRSAVAAPATPASGPDGRAHRTVVAPDGGSEGILRAVRELGHDGLLALPLDGWPSALRTYPARKWVRGVLSPLAVLVLRTRVRAATRLLSQAGLACAVIPSGDRQYRHQLGSSRWRATRARRLPVSAVVVGSRGPRPASLLDEALSAASSQLGRRLVCRSTVVTESSKILQRLEDAHGRTYLHRAGAGPAHVLVEQSVRVLDRLSSAAPPAVISSRVPWPVCDGTVGALRYSVEPWHAGRCPRRLGDGLWADCIAFTAALTTLGNGGSVGDAPAWQSYEQAVAAVAPRVPAPAWQQLRGLLEQVRDTIGHVPLGWTHGDLWPGNLLVTEGRLRTVVDWEWARPDGLPLGDLLDLVVTSHARTRRLGAGARVVGPVWSLLRSGDGRVRTYCEATGLGHRRQVHEGLAIARWLEALARDLQPCRAALLHERWAHENVERPLSFFREQGWA